MSDETDFVLHTELVKTVKKLYLVDLCYFNFIWMLEYVFFLFLIAFSLKLVKLKMCSRVFFFFPA